MSTKQQRPLPTASVNKTCQNNNASDLCQLPPPNKPANCLCQLPVPAKQQRPLPTANANKTTAASAKRQQQNRSNCQCNQRCTTPWQFLDLGIETWSAPCIANEKRTEPPLRARLDDAMREFKPFQSLHHISDHPVVVVITQNRPLQPCDIVGSHFWTCGHAEYWKRHRELNKVSEASGRHD